ncbi:1-acyl-sn-glycerol-3-phosphate acyltransferase [Spiroplasma endosymbiont of Anurida maritima]|uniref:lysophospholipid acyltransferase family protein n=1 Tax=Spiroplasma endosymbiont of Anurida maritima TaxID=2967972 RepID=UPI0036D32585
MNLFKILITLPRFVRLFLKSRSMTKKIAKDPNYITEEFRYIWLQKRARYILWLMNIKLIVHDEKNWLDKGCLVIANHQSNVDPLIIFALNNFEKTSPCAFIAKKELNDSRLYRRFIHLIDVLLLDRKNPRQAMEVIQQANELIRVPRSMVVFPEGTRSHTQEMGEFHSGTFKIAQKAHCPIIPVSIIDSYKIKNKNFKKSGKKYITVVFNEPLKPSKFIEKDTKFIANIVKSSIQKGIDRYQDKNNGKEYKKYKVNVKDKTKENVI